MDYRPEGHDDFLLQPLPSQDRSAATARRTHHFLLAARIVFIFSHGALIVTSSVTPPLMGEEADWWVIFLPVWLGNAACAVMIILSWFASCPYIQLCLGERQARLGDSNPSILTEIIPDIVMAIVGLMFILLLVIGETVLCQYIERAYHHKDAPRAASAVVLILVGFLTCCHGVCIVTHGAIYTCLGGGALATVILALWIDPMGSQSWVVLLPSVVSCLGLLTAFIRRSRQCSSVLTCEERILRVAEQFFMVGVTFALVGVVLTGAGVWDRSLGPVSGAAAGTGVCIIAALRARMVIVENKQVSIRDRLVSSKATMATQALVLETPSCSGTESASEPPTPT